ncbi:MAG: Calx-beta domain-containing protein, partial [Nitrospirota bacterium]
MERVSKTKMGKVSLILAGLLSFSSVGGVLAAPPAVTLSSNVSTISENGGSGVITATLSAVETAQVTILLSVGGAAKFDLDYGLSTVKSIIIPPNTLTGTVNLTTIDDELNELDEAATVEINEINSEAVTPSATQKVSINISDDNDPKPVVSIDVDILEIDELGGDALFTITLDRKSGRDVMVTLAKSGTASPTDYTLSTTTITIPEGQLDGTVRAITIDDDDKEPNETIILTVNAADGGDLPITKPKATVTIADNDLAPTVTLSVDNPLVPESGGVAKVTATMESALTANVVVTLIMSGTAKNGVDYKIGPTITIPAGQTTAFVTFSTMGDALSEGGEAANIGISEATGATFSFTEVVTINIVDDDGAPTVTITTISEKISEASGKSTIIARLSAKAPQKVIVTLERVGTATNGVDYTVSERITIPAGKTRASVTLRAKSDKFYERVNGADEFVELKIKSVEGAEIGIPNSLKVVIVETSRAPAITFAVSPQSVIEGQPVKVAVKASGKSANSLPVCFTFGGTASRALDYTTDMGTSTCVTIIAGALTAVGTITTIDDDIFEGKEVPETIIVTLDLARLKNAVSVRAASPIISILDNDPAPTVFLTSTSTSVLEGKALNVDVKLSNPSALDVRVVLTVEGSTATDADYTLSTKTVDILAGQVSVPVILGAKNDLVDEPEETVIFKIQAASNASLGIPSDLTINITDTTPPPTVSLSASLLSIKENAGVSTITATLNNISGFPVTVNLTATGTAIESGDYLLIPKEITIPAGSKSASVSLTASDDPFDEEDEEMVVVAVKCQDATFCSESPASSTVTVKILDDDAMPKASISVLPLSIAEEGGSAAVTVTLTAISGRDVKATLEKKGTAKEGDDYTLVGEVIVPAGTSSASVTITSKTDTLDEEDEETVSIKAVCGTGSNCLAGTVVEDTVKIVDDDLASTVTLTLAPLEKMEDATTGVFVTATLDTPSGKEVKVALLTDGTASSTIDYTLPKEIVIPEGSTTTSVTLAVTADPFNEEDETVIIDFGTITNGTTTSLQTKTFTIKNDDLEPTVELSVNPDKINENGTTTDSVITLTLSEASGFDITVTLTATGTAKEPSDYTLTSKSVLIPAGTQSANVTLSAVNNDLFELDETVMIEIDTVGKGFEKDVQKKMVTIVDDEPPPTVTLSVNEPVLNEETGTTVVMITATLDAVSDLPTTVPLLTSGVAINGTDYDLAAQIDIPAGVKSVSVPITTKPDALYEKDEAILVDIGTVVNGTRGSPGQVSMTIVDDDPLPTVTLGVKLPGTDDTSGDGIVKEDSETATIRATLNVVSGLPTTVNLIVGGDAKADDYTLATQIVIPAGAMFASVTLTPKVDLLNEDDEMVIIDAGVIENGEKAATFTPVTVKIVNDDDQPSVSLSASPESIKEDSGTEVKITAKLSAVSSFDVKVPLLFSGIAVPSEYTVSGASITIPAGSIDNFVTLGAVSDPSFETNETVLVDMGTIIRGVNGSPAQATTTIENDDAVPIVTLKLANQKLNEDNNDTNTDPTLPLFTTVTAEINVISGIDTVVTLTAAGSAKPDMPNQDFNLPLEIKIPVGELSASVILAAIADTIDETDEETVIITMACGMSCTMSTTTPATQTVSIFDNDIIFVTLSVDTFSVVENGGVATLSTRATLGRVSIEDIIVTIKRSDSSIANADDYTLADTITILAGQSSGSSTLTAKDDPFYEGDETVDLEIIDVKNATEQDQQVAFLEIVDDDPKPTVTLSALPANIKEGGTGHIAQVTAEVDKLSALPTTVTLAKGGTAADGVDYQLATTTIIVPAMQKAAAISLTATHDLFFEKDETVTVSIIGVVVNGTDGSATQTVTILNNDLAPVVTLSVDSETIGEVTGTFGTSTKVTASLSAPSNLEVKVTLVIATSTATEGSDYNVSSKEITIPAGDTAGFVVLASMDDLLYEEDETFTISIATTTESTIGTTSQKTVKIVSDELPPTVTFTQDKQLSLNETGTMTITAELSAVSGLEVTVPFTLSGFAKLTDDYTITASPMMIAAGATTTTITITMPDDAIDEENETVIVTMGSLTNATLGATTTHTATITDDELPPTVFFTAAAQSSVNEIGTMTITAVLSTVSGLDVTVPFTVSGSSTAFDPSDYSITASPVIIPAGATTTTITITMVNDAIDEKNERVIVTMGTTTNATLGATTTHTATITDDEDPPTVSFTTAAQSSVNEIGTMTITAALSTVSGLDVPVPFTLSGSAKLTDDYTITVSPVKIVAGTTTTNITITMVNDAFFEENETVDVTMGTTTNATLGATVVHTATIMDDEPAPLVTLSSEFSTIEEKATGVVVTKIIATLDNLSNLPVTVNLKTGGMAKANDYTFNNAVINIPAGIKSGFVTLATKNDLFNESPETVTVDIDAVTLGKEKDVQQVTVTIADDDPIPTIALEVATLILNEDPAATGTTTTSVTARLSAISGKDVKAIFVLTGSTATRFVDFNIGENPTLEILIPAESGKTGVIMLDTIGDSFNENEETVDIEIISAENATKPGTQKKTVKILNDDPLPTVELLIDSPTIGEDAGGTGLNVTASLSNASGRPITVNLKKDGVAINGVDYTLPDSITIPEGTPSAAVLLVAKTDDLNEFNEDAIITIDSVTNGFAIIKVGGETQTVIITDDDPIPTLSVLVGSETINEKTGTGTNTSVTVKLSARSGKRVTVTLKKSGATKETDDYTLSGTGDIVLTIPADHATGMVSVTLASVHDVLDEDDETVVVTIDRVDGADMSLFPEDLEKTVRILDDDALPTITLAVVNTLVTEDSATTTETTLTAALNVKSGRNVTVNLLIGGNAKYDKDYRLPKAIVIEEGTLSTVVSLSAVADTLNEFNETVVVEVDSILNGTSTGQKKTVTIADNDAMPTLTLSVAPNTSITENTTEATSTTAVIAKLSAPSGKPITVNLKKTGTATDNVDYTLATTTITIAEDDPSGEGSVTLTAKKDALVEEDEEIIIDILSLVNTATTSVQTQTVTIPNEQLLPLVTLSVGTSTIAETGGNTIVTATLDFASSRTITVPLLRTGTATLTKDYSLAEKITILAGALTGVTTVTSVHDTLFEGIDSETVLINIDPAMINANASDSLEQKIEIADDDESSIVTLSTNSLNIPETAGVASIKATLNRPSGIPVVVTLAINVDSTATDADFLLESLTITVPSGILSAAVTLSAAHDILDELDQTVILDMVTVENGIKGTSTQVTVKIIDDDDPPFVSISTDVDNINEEGTNTETNAIVKLDTLSEKDVTVTLKRLGIAKEADYTLSTSTLLIAAGVLDASAVISALPDDLNEHLETIELEIDELTLKNGRKSVDTFKKVVTITDDDPKPNLTLAVDPIAVTEDLGVTQSIVKVVIDLVSGRDIPVTLEKSGMATNDLDYKLPDTITIPEGQTEMFVTFSAVGDKTHEQGETAILDLSVEFANEVGQQQKTVTIANDDDPPIVTLLVGSEKINESGVGSSTHVIAMLSDPSSFPVTVKLGISGTGVEGTDYNFSGTTTIIVPAGTSSSFVTLSAMDNSVFDTNKRVVMDILDVTNGTTSDILENRQKTVTIIEDEGAPTVSLNVADIEIPETGGTTRVSLTLSEASALPVTIKLVKSGTAKDKDDYTLVDEVTIPAGQLEEVLTLSSVSDFLFEGVERETIIVSLGELVFGAKISGADRFEVKINDDDAVPTVTLVAGSPRISETAPANTTTIRATLSNVAGKDVIVTLTQNCGMATKCGTTVDTDFTLANKIVIPAGEQSNFVTLTATPDAVHENDETVIISIGGIENGRDVSVRQTVTIVNDDLPPTVKVSAGTLEINEVGGTTSVIVTLSSASSFDITVKLEKAGTAIDLTDYTFGNTTVLFPAGTDTQSVILKSKTDGFDEDDETVEVSIFDTGLNATEDGIQKVSVKILDGNPSPVVTLTAGSNALSEDVSANTTTITVTLDKASGRNVNVGIVKTDFATDTKDYELTDMIVILAGDTSKVVELKILDDELSEYLENITLAVLCDATCTRGSPADQTISITDNENLPTVSLSVASDNVSEFEGSASSTTKMTVALNTLSGRPVIVKLATSGRASGTSTAPLPNTLDYKFDRTIVIAEGTLFTTVTFSSVDDRMDEPSETVIINIAEVVNGTSSGLATDSQTITILDDDAPSIVTLTSDRAMIHEDVAAITKTPIRVALDVVSGFDVKVNLDRKGNASDFLDYNIPDSITVPAGQLTAFVDLVAVNDTLDEADEETVLISVLSPVVNGTKSETQETLTVAIVNDDLPPSVSLKVDSEAITEEPIGETAVVTAFLSTVSQKDIVVQLKKLGTAKEGVDYKLPVEIKIPAGDPQASVILSAMPDDLNEESETIIIGIGDVTNGTQNGIQEKIVKILDNEAKPIATLSVAANTLSEDFGVISTLVTVKLNVPSGQDITLTLSKNGTATDVKDYTLGTTTLLIPAGQTIASTTLSAEADALNEEEETIILDINTVENVLKSTTQTPQIVTISDNDPIPTVKLSVDSATINEVRPGESTIVRATLSAVSGRDVTVTLKTDGDATEGKDYTFNFKTFTISAGIASTTFTLTALDDPINEVEELVIVEIEKVERGLIDGIQRETVTILSDDAVPSVTLSVNKGSINEEGVLSSAAVIATLSTISSKTVTVPLVKQGTAKETFDYTLADRIVIPAGQSTASTTLLAVTDPIYEKNETVELNIGLVVINGTTSPLQQMVPVTLVDNELAPKVTLSVDNGSINEVAPGNTAKVTALLSEPSGLDVVVSLEKTGLAKEDLDYTLISTITVLAGKQSGFVTLSAKTDTLDEDVETFVIDIYQITDGTELDQQQQSVTILNGNLAPTVDLSIEGGSINENPASTTQTMVVATLSTASAKIVTVTLGKGGGAVDEADYKLNPTIIIPAGATFGSVTLTSVNDGMFEADETVELVIDRADNAVAVGVPQAVIIVSDDNPPKVSLLVDRSIINEKSSPNSTTVMARLDVISSFDTTVDLATNGRATALDYSLTTTIVIPAGTLSNVVSLVSQDDPLDEFDEEIMINLGSLTHGEKGTSSQVTVKLLDDDDEPSVTISAAASEIGEGTGTTTTTLTATLSTVSGKEVTVFLKKSGAAIEGVDYKNLPNQIVVPVGSKAASIDLNATDDELDEEDKEDVVFEVMSAENAIKAGLQTQTVMIVDDELPPVVTLSVGTFELNEDAGITSAIVTVSIDVVSGKEITVNLSKAGTAQDTVDYRLETAMLVIPPGSKFATTTLSSIPDSIDEKDETVELSINAVNNGAKTALPPQIVTILDDEKAPTITLTVTPDKIGENVGTVVSTVRVTLSAISGLDVKVDFVKGGSAKDGIDYNLSPTMTVFAGKLFNTISLAAIPDTLYEEEERIIITVDNIENGTSTVQQQKMVTLVSEDPKPTVSLSVAGTINETEPGESTPVMAVLNTPSGHDVTVTLTKSGIAKDGVDYTLKETIVVPAGQDSASIPLAALPDPLNETDDESVVIAIIGVVDAFIKDNKQEKTVLINDDDFPPSVTISVASDTMNEKGGATTVTATTTAPSSFDIAVTLAKSGAASDGVDYTLGNLMIIPAGETATSLPLTSKDDPNYEEDELVSIKILSLTSSTEAGGAGSQEKNVKIVNDDPKPTVTLSAIASIAETGGKTLVTATLSAASNLPVTLTVTSTNSPAIKGTDYEISTTTITIAVGQTTGSVTLSALHDDLFETNETVAVEIATVTDGIKGGTPAVVAIMDDESAPGITLLVSQVLLNEETSPTRADVSIQLNAESGQDVTVTLSKLGSTATEGEDYAFDGNIGGKTVIVVPAGKTLASVTLNVITDTLNESDETIEISIESVDKGTENSPQRKKVTILNDDELPTVTLSTNPANIAEKGGASIVTAALITASGKEVTVHLKKGGTATDVSDYSFSKVPIIITIPAGQITGSVTLSATDDFLSEDEETVTVDIDKVVHGTSTTPQGRTVKIIDDDPQPIVTLSVVGASSLTEPSGTTLVKAALNKVAGRDVTVTLKKTGKATDDADYELPNTILIPTGVISASVTFAVKNDFLNEENPETAIITINSVMNGVLSGTQQKTINIADEDRLPVVTLSAGALTIRETGGGTSPNATLVTATLDQLSGRDVTVTVVKGGNALFTTDYTIAGTIVIPAGQASGAVTLTAAFDLIDEVDETVVLNIEGSVTNGTRNSTQEDILVKVIDDDEPPVIRLFSGVAIIDEAGTSTRTAITAELGCSVNPDPTVTCPSSFDITVSLVIATSTKAKPTDYTLPLTIFIPAEETSGFVLLTAKDDILNEDDETVVIRIGSLIKATDNNQEVTVKIKDNDPLPKVILQAAPTSINEAAPSSVTVQLADASGQIIASGRDVIVQLKTSGAATSATDECLAVVPVAPNCVVDYTLQTQIVIPEGATSTTVVLSALGDTLHEKDEAVILDVDDLVINGEELGIQSQTVIIKNDDLPPTVSISLADFKIKEDKASPTSTVATVFLDTPSGLDTTITLSMGVDPTVDATEGEDYTLSNAAGLFTSTLNSILIPAGATSTTLTLTSMFDDIDEGLGEDVIFAIKTAENGTKNTNLTTVTIEDDDVTFVSLSAGKNRLLESVSESTLFTAKLDLKSNKNVVVNLVKIGNAKDGIDYALLDKITVPAGSFEASITFDVMPDDFDEFDETVTVEIGKVLFATKTEDPIGQKQTIEIVDEDATPTVALTIGHLSVFEDSTQGTATTTIIATLSAVSGRQVTVPFTKGGIATEGSTDDYTLSPLNVSRFDIPEGTKSVSIPVTVVNDNLFEENETIIFNLNPAPTHAEILNATQTREITIFDNEPPPTVTLSQDGVATIAEEPASGAISMVVTAKLSEVSGKDVRVSLVTGGRAKRDIDYKLSDSVITILKGDTLGTISITALPDSLNEHDEEVTVTISGTNGGLIGVDKSRSVTITDNDPLPTMTLEAVPPSIAEVDGLSTITAKLNVLSGRDVTVNLKTTGDAVQDKDYRMDTQIVIPEGAISASGSLVSKDDLLNEHNEKVTVDIDTVEFVSREGVVPVNVVIVDNDPLPLATLSVGSFIIEENGATTTNVTVSLAPVSGRTVTVTIAPNALLSNAINNTDYVFATTTLTIAEGATSTSITLTAQSDNLDEVDEAVVIDIDVPTFAAESGEQQQKVTIKDVNVPAIVTLSVNKQFLDENVGTTSMATVRLTLDTISAKDITVTLKKTPGVAPLFPAKDVEDYTLATSTVVITAGQSSTSTIFQVTADGRNEH